ncbi:unnamed protein product [Withania somnifera]
MEEEIKAEFVKNGFNFDDEADVLNKCLTFCIQYNLSPSDIVSSWDVYSLNRGLELMVQSSHMGAFLQQIQNERREDIVKKEPGLHLYSNDISMILNDEYENSKEIVLGTPTDKRKISQTEPIISAKKTNGSITTCRKLLETITPFGQRKSKFVVQFSLNETANGGSMKMEHDEENPNNDIIKRVQPIKRCSLKIISSQSEPGCRFMYDRMKNKLNFIESRIKDHATALVASGLHEEPTDPTVASQRPIVAVGMICCEEEGRLKEMPILLQSSVEHSGGQRVRLDLQNLDHFSVFPGQVVGLEGHNPSGHCLIALKIVDRMPLSPSSMENLPPTKRQAMDQHLESTNAGIIIAAGPFTTVDNLFFEPLAELLLYAQRKQPQLIILLGPFIDSDHPEIKRGTVNRTFDEIFQDEILARLRDYVEYMGCTARVILVPSVRDASHDFVYPQINSITNPGIFCANEVKVACSTVDVLKQLSAEEISRNKKGGSKQRMTTLVNHILNQRSFYPLYPPAEGVPIDFSLAPEALQMSTTLDILILPSDLAHFVRVISVGERSKGEEVKCICVNPGRLSRGGGGGFFAELNYHGHCDLSNASVIRI